MHATTSRPSEQLLQVVPQKLGRYLYYRLGETTIGQLADAGLIPKGDYSGLISKKPDGLVTRHKQVIVIVESKGPDELDTPAKEGKAISQEIKVAQKMCKILVITDNLSKTIWVNALTGERVLDRGGNPVTTLFDSKLTSNVAETERLVEEADLSLTAHNSRLRSETVIDPSILARRMWQSIYVATGKSPIKCLYNVVELLIFKFLSDLKVLDVAYSFDHVFKLAEVDPEDALTFYARNSRPKIADKFPHGADGTTIINGTIFVNERGDPNLSQAILFHHSLRHLQEYEHDFGSFVKIDRNFKTKLYETFLKQEVEALGQYFTTRKIVQSMVRMARLDEEDRPFDGLRIADPFCGVGGFLLEVLNLNERMRMCYAPNGGGKVRVPFVLKGYDKGFELDDERTIILAKANMLIYLSDVISRNASATREFAAAFNETFTLLRDNLGTFAVEVPDSEKYDYILTNPPYITRGAKVIKEEIRKKGLRRLYPVNGFGLESLAVEWIIRNLKPGGKAFVVLPDGVMERRVDRKLREYIRGACFVDAIVSLPIRTFFANERKTYVLAITKKNNPSDTQSYGVFTYVVSHIGEDLTKKTRDEIALNELPEMERHFAMYSAVRGTPGTYEKFRPSRCKIVDPAGLAAPNDWRIEKRWSEDEQVALGLQGEEAGAKAVLSALRDTEARILALIEAEKVKAPRIGGTGFVQFPIGDLFTVTKGSGKYDRKYIRGHPGPYPVYSSQTADGGVIGTTDGYDFDEPDCLSWTTDGRYAGTVFRRSGKFCLTSHAGVLRLRTTPVGRAAKVDPGSVDSGYVYHLLRLRLKREAIGQRKQNRRVTVDLMRGLELSFPVTDKGDLDKARQVGIVGQFDELEAASNEAISAQRKLREVLESNLFALF